MTAYLNEKQSKYHMGFKWEMQKNNLPTAYK